MNAKQNQTKKQRHVRQIVNALLKEIDRIILSVRKVEQLKEQLENQSVGGGSE